jgi:hypothetical protein
MDFAGMFRTWLNVLTRPGEEVFEEERQRETATFATAFIWIAIAAVLASIFGVFQGLIQLTFNFESMWVQILSELDPVTAEQLAPMMPMLAGAGFGSLVFAFCIGIVIVPVFFFMGSLLWFAVAKLFGGSGEFEEQTYLLGTFSAPITIVNAVLGIIPVLNICTGIAIFVYQLVLTYFALKVSHNLTSGRALGVILTLVGGVFLLLCCAVALLSFGMAALMEGAGTSF